MEFLRIAWLALAAAALGQAVLLLLQTHEHRRFARSRLKNPRTTPMRGRVALFAPCKGIDLELEQNLGPLFEQDYENYELVFIVESEEDPAYAAIRRLIAAHTRVSARLVVAGQATDTGQKVHNLLAGTADLSPAVEVLAFVDSDARPHPRWLRLLVQRLDGSGAAAATGYRWFLPTRPSIASYMQYGINAAAAVLYRPDARGLVWGGSWAIRRDAFERCGLRAAWHGTLSDDLVASRVLRQHGMRVEFEPGCMLLSPLDVSFRQLLEFLRRQYVIGRVYAPRSWLPGFLAIAGTALAFWGSLLGGLVAAAQGASGAWIPLTFCATWYALNAARGALRRDVAGRYFPDRCHELAAACRFDIWAVPLTALVNGAVMLAALVGRRITWRGNRYQLYPGGQIRLLNRPAERAAGAPHAALAGPHRAHELNSRTSPSRRGTHT